MDKHNDIIGEATLRSKYPTAKLIKNWEELKSIPNESETHILKVGEYNGWLSCKNPKDYEVNGDYDVQIPYIDHYLSTHTFYGNGNFVHSTDVLQKCGFNVILENWDKDTK